LPAIGGSIGFPGRRRGAVDMTRVGETPPRRDRWARSSLRSWSLPSMAGGIVVSLHTIRRSIRCCWWRRWLLWSEWRSPVCHGVSFLSRVSSSWPGRCFSETSPARSRKCSVGETSSITDWLQFRVGMAAPGFPLRVTFLDNIITLTQPGQRVCHTIQRCNLQLIMRKAGTRKQSPAILKSRMRRSERSVVLSASVLVSNREKVAKLYSVVYWCAWACYLTVILRVFGW
jgi:hypothetical protein